MEEWITVPIKESEIRIPDKFNAFTYVSEREIYEPISSPRAMGKLAVEIGPYSLCCQKVLEKETSEFKFLVDLYL